MKVKITLPDDCKQIYLVLVCADDKEVTSASAEFCPKDGESYVFENTEVKE